MGISTLDGDPSILSASYYWLVLECSVHQERQREDWHTNRKIHRAIGRSYEARETMSEYETWHREEHRTKALIKIDEKSHNSCNHACKVGFIVKNSILNFGRLMSSTIQLFCIFPYFSLPYNKLPKYISRPQIPEEPDQPST